MVHRLFSALQILKARGERRLLLLCGPDDWCQQQATLLGSEQTLWLGERHATDPATPINQATRFLGQEFDTVIFNGYSGLHPDMLAAASGMVKAGGVIALLMPPLEEWHSFADPDYQRYLSESSGTVAAYPHFLQRLQRLLLQQSTLWLWTPQTQHFPLSPATTSWVPPIDPQTGMTAEQADVVTAIVHCALGHRHRPVVVTADRGRGKSSALGIAAARLLREDRHPPLRLLVTAPSKNTVTTLQQHAHHSYDDTTAAHQEEMIPYFSPERLLRERPSADLLLVDEAAAIPTALLEVMLEHYPRVVFASTLHGYEGSGQGFALRMQRTLERRTPGWHHCQLHSPLRWRPDDDLEQLTNQLLLLDAEPAALPASGEYRLRWITQRDLATDETVLRQIMGLLILAHYQTTPSDLRLLLDNPDLAILIMEQADAVVGICLLTREGELPEALAGDIWRGVRRPRGHILPQTLLAHCGYADAGHWRYARLIRIAIHPGRQRQKLGTRMLDEVRRWCHEQHIDFFGAAFAASQELIAFWKRQGVVPVRLGLSRDSASGCFSIIMLQAITDQLETQLVQWHAHFQQTLPTHLFRQWRELSPALVASLVHPTDRRAQLPLPIWQEIASVAYTQRSPDHALTALQHWFNATPAQWLNLPAADQALLIRYLWQGWSLAELAATERNLGQRGLIQQLRAALRACYRPEDPFFCNK